MIAHTKIAAPTYLNIEHIRLISLTIVSLAFTVFANAGIANIIVPSTIIARHHNTLL